MSTAKKAPAKTSKTFRSSDKPEINLRHWLETSRFRFLPRGRFHKSFIYTYVQSILPELCVNTDINYPGKRNEWQKNGVDFALSKVKESHPEHVNQPAEDEHTGYWTFL